MLGAVMLGTELPAVIKAYLEIAEKDAKEPREVALVDEGDGKAKYSL